MFHDTFTRNRLRRSLATFDFLNTISMALAKPLLTIPDFALSPRIDQVGVEERAARFTTRSIKKETKMNGLKLVLNMIDLTTLEGKDTDGKVKQLCYKAMHPHDAVADIPTVAAICVYPSMVKVAKKALGDSGIKVASVATAFPSGQAPKHREEQNDPPHAIRIGEKIKERRH